MSTIRTIVIDDEQEARDGLELLLSKQAEFELLATCKNGLEAIEQIKSLKPDLIFLDIQMPKINGFEVLNSLTQEVMPKVIFVTAFDQYALKAFEVHACDYLLKPFSNARFKEAIAHALSMLQKEQNDLDRLQKVINSYMEQAAPKPGEPLIPNMEKSSPDQLIVKSSGKIIFIPLTDITHIKAENYYVKVYTGKGSYLVRESLKSLEEYLKDAAFMRIHKSTIVNNQYIKEVEPYFNGELVLKLTNGETLKVSRHYRKNLPKIFG